MIGVNRDKIEYFLRNFRLEDTIFVLDFDGTITLKGEGSSFDPISNSTLLAPGYMKAIGDYYRSVEMSSSFDEVMHILKEHDILLAKSGISFYDFRDILMQQWWDVTMMIAVKFNIDVENYDISHVDFRPKMKELLGYLIQNNYSSAIVSAGVENYISNFFRHNGFSLTDLNIIANGFVTDENGKALSYKKDLITAFTKQHLDYRNYGLDQKRFAIQFGDSLGDAYIVNDYFEEENFLKIGVTHGIDSKLQGFYDNFDIVLEKEDEGIDELLSLLSIEL